MVYEKSVKVNINALRLAKVYLDIVIYHYSLLDIVITNKSLVFTSNFCLLLCYLFGIKW